MKTYRIILLSSLVSVATLCSAQKKKPKKTLEQKSVEMTTKLSKEVKLTKEQQVQIKAIYLNFLTEKEALDNRMKELKKAKKKKVDEILTDEQRKKREELKKKKKK
ncbi:MAG: hypothetical protein KDD41_04210 [Flavobacteriales bacterium]|nr:hypothetical protein [Flavobacteriales bacterium]